MFKVIAGGALALGLLIGGGFGAETLAGQKQSDNVRAAVHSLLPDAEITRIDPHGRPFALAVVQGHEVSSAYVDVNGPGGRSLLILEGLNRDNGKVNSLLWFSHLPQPTPLDPVTTSKGVNSARGTARFQGEAVTVSYTAAVTGHTLCVRPQSIVRTGRSEKTAPVPAGWRTALTPDPVPLPTDLDLEVRTVSVNGNDISVELRAGNIDTAHPAGTGSSTSAGVDARTTGACRAG